MKPFFQHFQYISNNHVKFGRKIRIFYHVLGHFCQCGGAQIDVNTVIRGNSSILKHINTLGGNPQIHIFYIFHKKKYRGR